MMLRSPAKTALPKSLTENGYVPRSRLIFVRMNARPKHGLDPQRIKITPAHSSPLDERGSTVAGEVEIPPPPYGGLLERRVLFLKSRKDAVR